MLDVLRRNAGSWAIKIILILIAVTFISWGVGTYSERQKEVVAKIGDQELTRTELDEAAAGLEKTYREVYGAAFTPEMARALKLREQAMNSLVQRTILLLEAEKMGLAASDAEVQREIAATEAFQAEGRFSEDRYRSILAYNRVTPPEYEDAKRREITLRKMEGLVAAGARVTENEAREYFDAFSRRVRVLAVSADPAKIAVPPPSDGDLAALYDRTRESYRVPARTRLLVAAFDPGTIAAGVPEPADDKIRAYYDENADKFRTDEERLVSRILLPYTAETKEAARKKADGLLAEASRGKAAFDNAARRHGKGNAAAAWIKRRDAGPEAVEALFSAPVDTVVGPFETPKGFVLARVNQIRFPETLPLSQVRDRVVAAIRRNEAKDVAVVNAYNAQRAAAASHDLKGACAPFRVVPKETGWLEGKGDGSVPPQVVQESLMLQKNDVGPVATVGDAHYVFQVTAKEDSRVPALADVKDRVRAALVKERQRDGARAKLQQVLAASNTDAELERNAKAAGLAATTTPFFAPLSGALAEPLAKGGDALRREVLALSPKVRVLQKAFDLGGTFLGLAFVEERYPDAREWESKKAGFLKEAGEQKRARTLEAFLADRKRQEKVTIASDALK